MTVLTETLEQLEYWLWQHHPDLAASLNPGLTSQEIDNTIRNLPIQITQEIRELYQWTNGSSLFVTPCHLDEALALISLEKAIQYSYYDNVSEVVRERVKIPNLVMFWEFERWVHFAVCDQREASPILVITDDDYTRLAYSSLTSMVLTTLECYQREIFKIRDGWRRPILIDEPSKKKFNAIRNRNNQAFNLASIQERYDIVIQQI
ncbi:hypothetical protein [Calothrix sp. NIES-2098]|uniref:hypothetical protein n=1 Tax=Calothrix sp. NIES-2098 TaxID=1954171 RepID=UPI000B602959|nr:PBS lyase HEAT-like repeat protein [Calothrix sp. NIES-2098]